MFVITMYAVGCDVKEAHPTKGGTPPSEGFTVAADPEVLPLWSIVRIEGIGDYLVHDIGGKVKGHQIDLFVGDCKVAKLWGRRPMNVKILYHGRSRPRH